MLRNQLSYKNDDFLLSSLQRECWAKQSDPPWIVGKHVLYGMWIPLHTDSEYGSWSPWRIWKLDFQRCGAFPRLSSSHSLVCLSNFQSSHPANTTWAPLGEPNPTLSTLSSIGPLASQLPLPKTVLQKLKNSLFVPWVLSFQTKNIPSSFNQCPQASVVNLLCFLWSWLCPI